MARMEWHGRHGVSGMNSKDGVTDMGGLDGSDGLDSVRYHSSMGMGISANSNS